MKKTIIFCLASAVLAVSLIGGAAAMLDSKKETVLLDEEILYGDPAAAEGLQVTYEMPLEKGHVRWKIDQCFDSKSIYNAGFQYLSEIQKPLSDDRYSGLILEPLGQDWSGNDQHWYQDTMYEGVARNIPAEYRKSGEYYTQRVDLADYYDYLPLSLTYSVSGGASDWTPNGAVYALYRKINEVFRIPVTEDMHIRLRLTAETPNDGEALRSGYPMDDGSNILLDCTSVPTDDGVYFTFSVCPTNTIRLDVNEISLGYGIYYLPTVLSPLPFETPGDLMYRQPDPEGLCLGMPLDADAYDTIEEMVYQKEKDRLLILASKNGLYSLLIYEESSRKLLQTLVLTPPGKSQFEELLSGVLEQGRECYYSEGFYEVIFEDHYDIFTEEEDSQQVVGYADIEKIIYNPETNRIVYVALHANDTGVYPLKDVAYFNCFHIDETEYVKHIEYGAQN